MKKKYLFLCVAFVFFIYVVKFDVLGKLKRQYVEWKQVRFLDDEFHILKSKREIIELEKLSLYNPSLKEFLLGVPDSAKTSFIKLYLDKKKSKIETWVNETKSVQYDFQNQTVKEIFIYPKNYTQAFKKISSGLGKTDYPNHSIWDVGNWRIVFQLFDSHEDGYDLNEKHLEVYELHIFKFKNFDN